MTGSAAFITFKDKLLLILRDDNPEIPQPNCWGLPGGTTEPGETPEETLKRELEEEVNLRLRDNFKLLFQKHDGQAWIYHVWLSEDDVAALQKGNEGQRIEFFSIQEARQLPLTSNIKLYLAHYQRYLKEAGII